MRYLTIRFAAITLLFLGLFANSCRAQQIFRVNESQIRMQAGAEATRVDLPIQNSSPQTSAVHVLIELLDPKGAVVASARQDAILPPGTRKLKLSLPPIAQLARAANIASGPAGSDLTDFLWYRLRYTIVMGTPTDAATGKSAATSSVNGIVSVGEVTPDLFTLLVAGPEYVKEGGHYAIRLRAVHPSTGRPVAGVNVSASLDLDADDKKPLTPHAATTNRSGFATLDFNLPASVDTDEIDTTIKGKLRGYSNSSEGDIHVNHFSLLTISTDKPIYQPGQTLHARVMAFDVNRKAIAAQALTLEILDPDHTLVFQQKLKTSRFGIAAADWQIPDNLRLGDFQIQASFDENLNDDSSGAATVKIGRYELPTFTVTPKPDRLTYLPGQNASVEIRADYLFGEPVRHGHVRVVRESNRTWNYRRQKWDVDESDHWEGETDDRRRFVATIDLAKDHEDLRAADYERFRDISFAAYLTDSSTGRTEQRRFDLRLTKQPIHVYVISNYSNGQPPGLPLEFYLATDYADGSPASCDVAIEWAPDTPGNTAPSGSSPKSSGPIFLRRVHTNRYGVARVSNLNVPSSADRDANFSLNFTAKDSKGLIGRHTESLSYSDYPAIRVSTDKTLYKPGEPIHVQLRVSDQDSSIIVEAQHDSRTLDSQLVRIRGGYAELDFNATDTFQSDVTILAYTFGWGGAFADSSLHSIAGSHTVIFPKDTSLKVDVKFAKSTYRPGDEAEADLHVSAPDGSRVPSDVGLVVVDQAVAERVRTDQDFGGRGGFYNFRSSEYDSPPIGGIRRADLDKIDLSKPVPDGLDLVAEMLLQSPAYADFARFTDDIDAPDLRELFKSEIDPQIGPIVAAVNQSYNTSGQYPFTQGALEGELSSAGINFAALRDPWGMPFRARFYTNRERDYFEIRSSGPEKAADTSDDFAVATLSWEYFTPVAVAMSQAASAYHIRTNRFIRDASTLRPELLPLGVDLDTLKDRWGHAYQLSFGVQQSRFTITVTSAGPDGRISSTSSPSYDDFDVATIRTDYFEETRAKIESALAASFNRTATFPENLDQFRQALRDAGLDWDSLGDPWGHAYYATFSQKAEYADEIDTRTYDENLQQTTPHTEIVPVTRRYNWIYIRSAGEDGTENTPDDFTVASFFRGLVEQSSRDKSSVPATGLAGPSGATGAISGVVTDPTAAALPHATITATNSASGVSFAAESGDDGAYLVKNLPAGYYTVRFVAVGFNPYSVSRVPVASSNATHLNVSLRVGSVTETVTVEAANGALLQTSSATVITKSPVSILSIPKLAATPRLRDYFPETLLWRPEVLTDSKGFSHIKFPLAGNITTWQLSAVASTTDGQIGTAEKDVRAFQPFFVEHDPPQVLTVGDEIALPVVLRNYLDRPLSVGVAMKPSSWFTLESPASLKSEVPSHDSAREVFRFRAASAVKEGKQEVDASGDGEADAISRKIRVHPDGEERTASASQVFADSASLDLFIPVSAIPGSAETSLKIYPNLEAHVVESIEAIMERPYGCGEQTISSTYASVLLLKYAKTAGIDEARSPAVARAHHFAAIGYQRLLSFRSPDGGFSYWGKGDSDLALTVYAVRFLSDAKQFVPVDDAVIQSAITWVRNKARPDGHWIAKSWRNEEDPRQSDMLTAYIVRTLAESQLASSAANPQASLNLSADLRRSLAYLAPRVGDYDEPYILALYALSALDLDAAAAAASSIARLRSLEHREGEGSYWSLETNTPFYGWGLAGRIESTALVLQALAKSPDSAGSSDLISRGLLFLLHNQDRYGIWYSTQATFDVLNTLGSLTALTAADSAKAAGLGAANSKARVLVDGAAVASVDLPSSALLSAPILVDLAKFVPPGKHRIEIHRAAGSSRASVQSVADYYVPWTHSGGIESLHQEASVSDSLRLSVQFDKQSAKVGDEIHCFVEDERIGFHGYGMLLAEIGLPPGAEVDRNSLQAAIDAAGWDINSYDVLPDRLLVYLWPHAGGTKFSFSFKPRFGLKAVSAPSIVYDYYNPEAQAVVEPAAFDIE